MLSILNMIIFFWNLMSYSQIYEMFLNFLPSTKYYFYFKIAKVFLFFPLYWLQANDIAKYYSKFLLIWPYVYLIPHFFV